MSEQEHENAMVFLAGEDLFTGDLVGLDVETGKVMRGPQGKRCFVTLARGYRAGEVVEFPTEAA